MIYLLFICLSIGLCFFYYLNNRNILSCAIIGHISYMISTLVLMLSYNQLQYDISLSTVLIIEFSLIFLGLGEYVGVSLNKGKIKYPESYLIPNINVTRIQFFLCISVMIVNIVYSYYRFNYIGSQLGGDSFLIRYVLLREYLTTDEGMRGVNDIVVPYENYFSCLSFLPSAIVYTFVFVYSYNLFYKKKSDFRLLLPLFIYFPTLIFSTSRSIFIGTIVIIVVIISLVLVQSHRGWNNRSINKKIMKVGAISLLLFVAIFATVGSFKGQNVISNFKETMIAYAGASIIGLDKYVCGEISADSDYPGQVMLEGIIVFLNHFGLDCKLATYHQEHFYFGPYTSNIFSAPYYMLRDFNVVFVMLIYMFWGVGIGNLLGKMRNCLTPFYLPMKYVVMGYLLHPVVMLPITDGFRHITTISFAYTLVALYLIQRFVIKKSIKY